MIDHDLPCIDTVYQSRMTNISRVRTKKGVRMHGKDYLLELKYLKERKYLLVFFCCS